MVVTETWGGTISGYCAIGMEYSANAPAIVVTIAMTMARRGRSTKIDESMESTLLHALRQRTRLHRRAGTDPLQTLHDDRLTSGQA